LADAASRATNVAARVLAEHCACAAVTVETKKGSFEPEKFEDQYEDALKDLIRKKQKGEKIERPKEPSHGNVINLMDALRKSVKGEPRGARTTRKKRGAASKTRGRAHSRHRKAG
jgi:DNA end-binding protein Ku